MQSTVLYNEKRRKQLPINTKLEFIKPKSVAEHTTVITKIIGDKTETFLNVTFANIGKTNRKT